MRKPATFILALLVLAPPIAWAQHPDFSGTWEKNPRLSQDPFEKIEMAMGTAQLKGAGAKEYNAVNRGALLRDTDRVALRRLLLDYSEALHVMEIEQGAKDLKISVGEEDEFFSLFYLDGEAHARQLQDGIRIEATAGWEGDTLHIVQKAEGGATLEEIYSSMDEGRQLAVIFQLESKLTAMPVLFRTVYDRVDANE